MEKLPNNPEMTGKQSIQIEIPIYPFMKDHRFSGRIVIPAVELCQVLALEIKKHIPDINNQIIYNASFDKFIDINGDEKITALNEIKSYEDGTFVSKLLTKTKTRSGIIRTNEHVSMDFRKDALPFKELTYDVASALDGLCLRVQPQEIYSELVPFGPAYHNVTGDLYVADSGAAACIVAPAEMSPGPLGSPFVFDAALHAASVWAQRYHNTTAFPVAFSKRIILKPAEAGKKYFTRIIPVQSEAKIFKFDIWIYDYEGVLREAGFGVSFRDVTGGTLQTPEWITKNKNNLLYDILSKCDAFSVVELDQIPEFASKALSIDELRRLEPMREKRRKSYTGARLACKFLSRKLSKESFDLPADKITTIINNIYPACPLPDGSMPYKCTVSHDSRFAVAAASRKRIGIDVEEISERVIELRKYYMSEEEQNLVDSSGLEKKAACLRIWSIKEAVTKALDIDLTGSWKSVQVMDIGENITKFLINNIENNAYHCTIDNHIFTLVQFGE
ncbi:MAG: 4'-phosphopantetheinyl transferase superfamily protein [Spirochaetota bacterium]